MTIRPVLLAIILVGAALLTACGTPTPYQPAASDYGYDEQALEENRYRISFSGNSLTPRETVENYLLYRAAEVTLDKGYDYFLMVTQETERKTTYHGTITGFGSRYHDYPYGIGASTSTTAYPQDRYSSFATITLHHGSKPADDPKAYDARQLQERLAPTIARPVTE